jgi:hypothetical protein
LPSFAKFHSGATGYKSASGRENAPRFA